MLKMGTVKGNPGACAVLKEWQLAALCAGVAGVLLGVLGLHMRLPIPRPPHLAAPDEFVAENAHRHLINLTSIGPRVAGSYENDVLAVARVAAELRHIAEHAAPHHVLDVDVQVASGAFSLNFMDGLNNVYRGVRNVVARVGARGGRRSRHALLFNCHLDTVPDSPGGSDDGAGCAVLLELARALAASRRLLTHDAIFLFNGAEENIMQASHAFITQHKWAKSVRAFINLEACGAGGREVLFQAGPGDPWILETYAALAPHPFGSSLAQEIFESGLIPSDTDFRVFRDFGNLSGVDFAWSGNGYVYHTKLDTASRVAPAVLQHTGDNVLALARGLLLRPELEQPRDRARQPVFFDVLGLAVVVMGRGTAAASALLAAGLGLCCAWNAGADAGKGRRRARALVEASARLLCALVAGVMSAAGLAGVVAAAGGSLTWYARPGLLLPLYALPALAGAGLVHARLWQTAPRRGTLRADLAGAALLSGWAALGLVAAAVGLASGFVALFWTVPMVLAHVAQHYTGGWLRWRVVGALPGMMQTSYLAAGCLHMFVPVAGRAGAVLIIEVVMAVLVSVLALGALAWLLPLLLVTRRAHMLLWGLAAVGGAGALLATVSPAGVGFSELTPQRVMAFHTRRTTHAPLPPAPRVAYWLPALDVLVPGTLLDHVPSLKSAQQMSAAECGAMLYCGAPYTLPVSSFISRAYWMPAATEPRALVRAAVRADRSPRASVLHFNITGPSHVVVIVSPCEGARVTRLSLLGAAPLEGPRWGSRRTYFTTLHHSQDHSSLWTFTMNVQMEEDGPAEPEYWADVSVAGHCMSGECKEDASTRELWAQLPAWVAATGWATDLHLYRV